MNSEISANPTYDSQKKAEEYGSMFDGAAFWRYVDDYSLKQMLGDLTGNSVLDMGCGDGRICRKVCSWYPLKKVVGVDFSGHCIEQARKQTSDKCIEYIHRDATTGFTLEIANSFDVVISVYVLQYAQNYEQTLGLLRTAYNNLKHGGRFVGIFSAYSPCIDLEGYNQFFNTHFKWSKGEHTQYGPIQCLMLNGDRSKSLEMQIYATYPETFRNAVKEIGFDSDVRHPIRVDPAHEHEFDTEMMRKVLRYVYHFEAFKS